jgi:nitric oxide reductase subunit B
MTYNKKLWAWLAGIFIVSFGILGLIGREIYVQAPPVPERVVTTGGQQLFTKADIQTGREVWQTLGGMELGSVWGHGGYVAPDWGADWLHRESTALLDIWAERESGKKFAALPADEHRKSPDLGSDRRCAGLHHLQLHRAAARGRAPRGVRAPPADCGAAPRIPVRDSQRHFGKPVHTLAPRPSRGTGL